MVPKFPWWGKIFLLRKWDFSGRNGVFPRKNGISPRKIGFLLGKWDFSSEIEISPGKTGSLLEKKKGFLLGKCDFFQEKWGVSRENGISPRKIGFFQGKYNFSRDLPPPCPAQPCSDSQSGLLILRSALNSDGREGTATQNPRKNIPASSQGFQRLFP